MTAGPGDRTAAAVPGCGHLRASHADREHVIHTLKIAFVQGRLTKDEFDQRVSQTFASRTHAELASLTADLPAGLAEAQPPRRPAAAQDQQPVNKQLLWGACAITVAAVTSMAAAFPADNFLLLVAGVLAILIAAPVAGTLILDSWREKRSRGQLPPRAPQSGQARRGERDDRIGDDLIPCEARDAVRARPLPDRRLARRAWWSLTGPRDQRHPANLRVRAEPAAP